MSNSVIASSVTEIRPSAVKQKKCKIRKDFDHLIVSDEAWFSKWGHVFNIQINVLYSTSGDGTPDQCSGSLRHHNQKGKSWCSISYMDLGRCLDHTSVTRDTIWMPTVTSGFWLTDNKKRIGLEEFNLTIWQQDGAKPHQANIVMDYLDGIFRERMLGRWRWNQGEVATL